LKGRVSIIDSASEDLSYGMKYSGDDRRFVSGDVFRRFLKNHKVAVVVMKKRFEEFRSSGLAGLLVDVRRAGNVALYENYKSRGKGLLPKPNVSSKGARRVTWRPCNIAYRLSWRRGVLPEDVIFSHFSKLIMVHPEVLNVCA